MNACITCANNTFACAYTKQEPHPEFCESREINSKLLIGYICKCHTLALKSNAPVRVACKSSITF